MCTVPATDADCSAGGAIAWEGLGVNSALIAIPQAMAPYKIVTGNHSGTEETPALADPPCLMPGVTAGKSWTRRAAVAGASVSADGTSGIRPMLLVRLAMTPARGSVAHLAASAHGSQPSRAVMDNIVRADPFSSLPTSAYRNASRPEFFSANTLGYVICVNFLLPMGSRLTELVIERRMLSVTSRTPASRSSCEAVARIRQ